MSKNWSKIVLVSMVVLMVGASLSMASTARVRTLANTGDYIPDDSNVNRWYSTLPSYANQVTAEMGFISFDSDLDDTRSLSWNIACGDEAEYGTYRLSLNENALDHPGLWMVNPFPFDEDTRYGCTEPAGYQWFRWHDAHQHLGPRRCLGNWRECRCWCELHALGATAPSRKTFDGNESNVTNSWTTIGVGGTWSNNEDLVLDGVFNFGMAGGDIEDITVSPAATLTAEWDSKNAIDFAGRAMWDWKDDVTVTPVVEFCTAEYSITSTATQPSFPFPGYEPGRPNGDKWTNFMLGVGMDMDVNSDNTLIFAVEFHNMKWEFANPPTSTDPNAASDTLFEVSSTYLPTFRLALESDVTSWMTTRVGAAKTLGKVTQTGHPGWRE